MPERPRPAWQNLPWPEALALAVLLGLAGYLMAWVPHPAPALRIAGWDLGEYVKFLPEVRAGQVRVLREAFYLPLFAGALALLLAAWSMRRIWRWPARLLALPLAAVVALLMLPPVWTPQTLFRGEFRWQGTAIVACLLATALSPLLLRPGVRRAAAAFVAFLCALAAVLPVAEFFTVKPALERVYARALPVGAGVWLSLGGFLLAAACSVALGLASPGPLTTQNDGARVAPQTEEEVDRPC
ncbi:MAG: hypothetical protein ACP5UM_01415 [Anaerolineae bacterium]